MVEYIALISIENGMKSLREMLLILGEKLHYVRNKCMGLSNLHMAAYNDTNVRLVLQRIPNKLRTFALFG